MKPIEIRQILNDDSEYTTIMTSFIYNPDSTIFNNLMSKRKLQKAFRHFTNKYGFIPTIQKLKFIAA